MVASQLIFFSFSFVFFSFLHLATGTTCPTLLCPGSGPIVTFPFRLTDQFDRCGYPGFDLSCNMSKTFLHLPNSSGNGFVVEEIDYKSQNLIINDPDLCLPKRFLDNSLSLLGSPFEHFGPVENFTFLNCSSDWEPPDGVGLLPYFPCLIWENYRVVALQASVYNETGRLSSWPCVNISTVAVPVLWLRWSNPEDGVFLTWGDPDCVLCKERGGICGFKKFKSQDLDIRCTDLPTRTSLPRVAKYGIFVVVAIPGLLCFIGLGCYLCGRVRTHYARRRFNERLSSTFILAQRSAVPTGLDGSTIESLPKVKLGESGRLPNPDDKTCPICLGDYQPKETLRTMPQCKHYFHANCIDEWLKMNTTCPLCRNSPESPETATPSTSTSSNWSSSEILSVP